jgi:uncharacterized SAM-dependent methyltransferase
MSYNKQQYEHLQKWKKERRKYEKPIWSTESMYVDTETGEIILKRRLENGEYIKLKSSTKYKTNERHKIKTITSECRKNPQQRLWDF